MPSGAKPVATDELAIGRTVVFRQQALRPAQRQGAHARGVRPLSTERSGLSQRPVKLLVSDDAYAWVLGRHASDLSRVSVTT